MQWFIRFSHGLERRGLQPAYGGGVLLSLAIFLFAAATNTLAGWLYVMSGIMLALLALATRLPRRSLQGVTVERGPIPAVSAGERLTVEVWMGNRYYRPQGLFQVIDPIPPALGPSQSTALRRLDPGQVQPWLYHVPTTRRGIYRWSTLTLRSAAPLGLFWYRRDLPLPATAVVYPALAPLVRCPMIDVLGNQAGQQWHYHPVVKPATEGVTRSLRPYRWGDPTRLIHWRTSARYGKLRVREMEKVTASQEVVITLNTQADWSADSFEQAVTAAASLYHYALAKGLAVALWLPPGECLQDRLGVLMALAGVAVDPHRASPALGPAVPTIWLTSGPRPSVSLVAGSYRVVWDASTVDQADHPGETDPAEPTLWMRSDRPLQDQLQAPLASALARGSGPHS